MIWCKAGKTKKVIRRFSIIFLLITICIVSYVIYKDEKSNKLTAQNNKSSVQNLFLYHAPFNKSEKIINGVNILASGQGFRTNDFTSNSPNVQIKIKGSFTTSNVSIKLGINKNSGDVQYIEETSLTNGNIDYTFIIDASNLNVYLDAKSFFILINTSDTSGKILYESISIQAYDGFSEDEHILSYVPKTNYMCRYNMPTKILFLGNSLLLGMDTDNSHGGAFGMASTSPQNDYAYYVEQAILQKNKFAEFSKFHIGEFEMAENNVTANNYISANKSIWTEKDLVIVQLGENVNNDKRRQTFKKNFKKLISDIRSKSPNAVILCVTGWYYNEEVSDIVLNTCKNYNCGYLNISHLYTTENKATNHVGETVKYYDGNTTNIRETLATHPYNTGMKAIADEIIEILEI